MICDFDLLPIFKTHYSLGKSILTLEKSGSSTETGPDSIVDIAEKNNLTSVYLVEDNISSLFVANQNLASDKIALNYGVRLTICSDLLEKSEESLKSESKIIVFAKTAFGQKLLIKIWDIASINGFYYTPRIDCKSLKSCWDDEHLLLCIPFYDSYIYNNLLTTKICLPDFSFANPIYFLEKNELPFEHLVTDKILSLGDINTINVQSIFYKTYEDFKAYQAFRCISNRSSIEKPNFDHMCSNTFCFESWCDKTEREMI